MLRRRGPPGVREAARAPPGARSQLAHVPTRPAPWPAPCKLLSAASRPAAAKCYADEGRAARSASTTTTAASGAAAARAAARSCARWASTPPSTAGASSTGPRGGAPAGRPASERVRRGTARGCARRGQTHSRHAALCGRAALAPEPGCSCAQGFCSPPPGLTAVRRVAAQGHVHAAEGRAGRQPAERGAGGAQHALRGGHAGERARGWAPHAPGLAACW